MKEQQQPDFFGGGLDYKYGKFLLPKCLKSSTDRQCCGTGTTGRVSFWPNKNKNLNRNRFLPLGSGSGSCHKNHCTVHRYIVTNTNGYPVQRSLTGHLAEVCMKLARKKQTKNRLNDRSFIVKITLKFKGSNREPEPWSKTIFEPETET
jgi:hypothetical protein